MIVKIYTESSNSSSRKAVEWCKQNDIDYQEVRLPRQPLAQKEIKAWLVHTENGLEDLLRRTCDRKAFDNLSLAEATDVLIENTHMLKKPILFDGKCLLIGYNPEEIRCFLPREKKEFVMMGQICTAT